MSVASLAFGLRRSNILSPRFLCIVLVHLFAFVPLSMQANAQQAPVANAGGSISVSEGDIVTIDGSASSDPDPNNFEPATGSLILPGGTSLGISLDEVNSDGLLSASVSIGEGVGNEDTAIVYVIDVSLSANATGGCAGDQNGDGQPDRIIDCEIAAALSLHEEVLASGTVSSVGLVSFDTRAVIQDLDPTAAGVQALVPPDADRDNNGILDFEEQLRNIPIRFGTSFTAAVQAACDVLAGSEASSTPEAKSSACFVGRKGLHAVVFPLTDLLPAFLAAPKDLQRLPQEERTVY